jgi:hypothetical protein
MILVHVLGKSCSAGKGRSSLSLELSHLGVDLDWHELKTDAFNIVPCNQLGFLVHLRLSANYVSRAVVMSRITLNVSHLRTNRCSYESRECFCYCSFHLICIPCSVETLRKLCFVNLILQSVTFARENQLRLIDKSCFQYCGRQFICIPRSVQILRKSYFARDHRKPNQIDLVTFESGSNLIRVKTGCFRHCLPQSICLLRSVDVLRKLCFTVPPDMPNEIDLNCTIEAPAATSLDVWHATQDKGNNSWDEFREWIKYVLMSEQRKLLQECPELAFTEDWTVTQKNPRGTQEQIRTRSGMDLKDEQT